jgi:hypothetical protein
MLDNHNHIIYYICVLKSSVGGLVSLFAGGKLRTFSKGVYNEIRVTSDRHSVRNAFFCVTYARCRGGLAG